MYGSRYVKFNSKLIKFPKLHKVSSQEAININKPRLKHNIWLSNLIFSKYD